MLMLLPGSELSQPPLATRHVYSGEPVPEPDPEPAPTTETEITTTTVRTLDPELTQRLMQMRPVARAPSQPVRGWPLILVGGAVAFYFLFVRK